MLQISLADLIATRVPVSSAEGVALTLAVADALGARGAVCVPADEHVFLSSTGQVCIECVSVPTLPDGQPPTPDGALAADLAAMLRRILKLEDAGGADRRRVPGGLLVLLARSLRELDLPQPPLDEFLATLVRYGTPETTTVAAIFWRAAQLRLPSVARPQPVALMPVRPESDRRRRMPASSELRRYLRDIERELYETRAHAAPSTPTARKGRGTVHDGPLLSVRGTAVATIVGAVIGTSVALLLSGADVKRAGEESDTTGIVSTIGVANAASDSDTAPPKRPIRTTRSVQPLLLAAAVGTDVFSPSFSARGRTLLFHAGRKASPLMRASVTDAGEVERVEKLVDDGAANYHVTMSPDGGLIAYDSDRDGVRGVYVASADGAHPRRISGSGYAAVPSWSPDGTRVAFVRAEPGHPRVWNVWMTDVASGRRQRVTEHRVGQPWGASWFPDGRRLAYSVEDRLMVADLDSGMSTGYRSPRAGRLVRTPAVSPDGRRVVFQVQRDGVWLLDLQRARMRRILADATAEEFVWSPAGDAIAYHARRDGSYGLWRLALRSGAN